MPLPPAKDPLAGVVVSGNSLSPAKECWPELAAICGARFYGERILIGADERFRAPAPASKVLTVGQSGAPLPPAKGSLAGVVVSGNSLSPTKECWPEQADLWHALLR